MSPTVIAALIGGLAGLFSGTIASLIAPWVQWAIEKRRKALEYKNQIISDVRKLLDEKETIDEIKSSSFWGFIKENLNEKEKETIFSDSVIVIINDTANQDIIKKREISNMLSRLEKEWKLISS